MQTTVVAYHSRMLFRTIRLHVTDFMAAVTLEFRHISKHSNINDVRRHSIKQGGLEKPRFSGKLFLGFSVQRRQDTKLRLQKNICVGKGLEKLRFLDKKF